MEREITKSDDWPLELGPHLTGGEARKVRAFIRSYWRYFAFNLEDLKSSKENPSIFSWKTMIPFFGDLTGLVIPRGLVSNLVKITLDEESL